jgi:hypothetical protein
MNRDFEFKQLLRAYRAGIITEATFEKELAEIEHGAASGNGAHAFEALGKTYGSEREAVVAVLDRLRAGEAGGDAAFSGWDKTVSAPIVFAAESAGSPSAKIIIRAFSSGACRIWERSARPPLPTAGASSRKN